MLFALAALAFMSQADDRFSRSSFDTWLNADPGRPAQFAAFDTFLKQRDVSGVVPTFQLWRTTTESGSCHADAFVVPDRADWPHLVATLRYLRDKVEPVTGPIEVVSAYRNEALNACAGGAPKSAHRQYYAVDLIPLDPALSRGPLIDKLCRLHAQTGAAATVGLGLYSGHRFHIDTHGFRTWGADGRGASSPCR